MFVEPVQCLPLYRWGAAGKQHNITQWGLAQFRAHYRAGGITHRHIFAYVYAVLHATAYRQQYAQDLGRYLPRLPFYEDFYPLAEVGERLLNLHVHYEEALPYGLARTDKDIVHPLPRLRRSRTAPNDIAIDEATTLHGVPPEAWRYTLGRRAALAWVLDQYKEKKDELPTIGGVQPYRFADHKEEAIALLQRICTVSCETMRCITEIDCIIHPRRRRE